MDKAGKTRLIAALIAAALGVAVLASLAVAERQTASAARAGSQSDCKNADDPVRTTSTAALRKSVTCLLNEERRRHARKPVAKNKRLQEVSQDHAQVMVKTDCLSHQCEGEASLDKRVKRSGYFQGAERWGYAENTGCGLSAEAMVANWMASRFHRINILDKRYEDVGVGAVRRGVSGRCGQGYGTFAIVFGFRD